MLIIDAKKQLESLHGSILIAILSFHKLLYADNTLLIDVSGATLEKFMLVIAEAGREYGLKLNWKKVEYLPVRCSWEIYDADGNLLDDKDAL